MELKITKEEQNPLFDRKEIIATLVAESLPKRQEVIKSLSEKYSLPIDALRVLDIKGKFGEKEFIIRAHIYPSNEERDKYEKLTKKEKEAEKSKPVEPKGNADETSAKEKPEEKPTEEVKTPVESQESADVKTPAEEAKKIEEQREEEDKKEKDKSKEEKLNETELQA